MFRSHLDNAYLGAESALPAEAPQNGVPAERFNPAPIRTDSANLTSVAIFIAAAIGTFLILKALTERSSE